MSQPELEWDDEERALLKSAELDGPAKGAQARTLAALGVGGAALGTAVTASSAKAAALGAGKGIGLGKLLAVLVIGGAVGGAVLHYRAQVSAAKLAPPATLPAKAAAPLASAARVPEAAPAAAPEASDVSAASGEQRPSEAPKAAPARLRTEPDIALEIAALDRARRASESGNFSAALAELDAYEHAFKRGRLRPEALLLRIQTLINKGDLAGARSLGTKFLARYPKSPLGPRIQKLVGATK
jgi:TolA-binding protein